MNFTHPCFLCWACGPDPDCGCQPLVPTYRVPMNQTDAAPAGSPTSQPDTSPLSPASTPTIPTNPSSTNTKATNQLVMSASPVGAQHGT